MALEGDRPHQCIDAVTDSIVASVIGWFSVSAAGAELESAGMVVEGAQDAAIALALLVGQYTQVLFGAGVIGASFLEACVPLPVLF